MVAKTIKLLPKKHKTLEKKPTSAKKLKAGTVRYIYRYISIHVSLLVRSGISSLNGVKWPFKKTSPALYTDPCILWIM